MKTRLVREISLFFVYLLLGIITFFIIMVIFVNIASAQSDNDNLMMALPLPRTLDLKSIECTDSCIMEYKPGMAPGEGFFFITCSRHFVGKPGFVLRNFTEKNPLRPIPEDRSNWNNWDQFRSQRCLMFSTIAW